LEIPSAQKILLILSPTNIFPMVHLNQFAIEECRIAVAYPGIFSGEGGVQQIRLRTGDRETGDLGVVAP
jgi:hypothetical protein